MHTHTQTGSRHWHTQTTHTTPTHTHTPPLTPSSSTPLHSMRSILFTLLLSCLLLLTPIRGATTTFAPPIPSHRPVKTIPIPAHTQQTTAHTTQTTSAQSYPSSYSSSSSSTSTRSTKYHPSRIPIRASDALIDAHVSIQQLILQPPPPPPSSNASKALPLLSVEVALFTVHLSRHFEPRRHMGLKKKIARKEKVNSTINADEDDLAESEFFPEEYESSSEGLTRLACGAGSLHARTPTGDSGRVDENPGGGAGIGVEEDPLTIFESFPSTIPHRSSIAELGRHATKARLQAASTGGHTFRTTDLEELDTKIQEHHKPDVYLLPLDAIDAFHERKHGDYIHPLYELMHPLFGSAPHVVSSGSRLRYALLTSMEWLVEDTAVGVDSPAPDPPSPAFHVLDTPEELLTCALHFLPESHQLLHPTGVYEDHRGHVLRGSIHFTPTTRETNEQIAIDARDVEHIFEVARKILPTSELDQKKDDAADGDHLREDDLLHSILHPPTSSHDPASSSPDPDSTSFLATDTHMMFFGELAKQLTSAILKPIATPVAGVMNGQWFDQVKEKLFQTQEGDLANEIPNQLIRAEIAPTVYETVKQISETMGEEFPPMLSTSLTEAVTPTITETMVEAITTKTAAQLARSAPYKIGKALIEMTVPEILLPLGHILTKSLSLALTPVILHTLDATPHMDYYCYFCASKQLYCDYCSFAPKQIYYANYYAAYYSTYYANYYVRFSVDAFQRQRNPLDYSHKTQILSMPDDAIEIVIPADETVSMWKEEERRKGTLHFSKTLRPQDKA